MDDLGEILTNFEKLYGKNIDHEVIKLVLQECQWNEVTAHQRLSELTGLDKQACSEPSENCWSSIVSKAPAKSKVEVQCQEHKELNFEHNEEIDRIKALLNERDKVLIIMRGLPGSGKSFLCKKLNTEGVTLSTDDYFYDRSNNYNFKSHMLSEAHRWNLDRTKFNMHRNISPIFIDNTNLQQWEFQPYINLAFQFNYHFDFLEPQTSWKYNCHELARKNCHNVSKQKIEEMKDRFEMSHTNDSLSLKYQGCISNQDYFIKDRNNAQIDAMNIGILPDNELSAVGSNKGINEFSLTENIISEQLFSTLVTEFNGHLQKSLNSEPKKHLSVSTNDVDANDEEMYVLCSGLENTLGLPVVSMANSEMINEGIVSLKDKVSKSTYEFKSNLYENGSDISNSKANLRTIQNQFNIKSVNGESVDDKLAPNNLSLKSNLISNKVQKPNNIFTSIGACSNIYSSCSSDKEKLSTQKWAKNKNLAGTISYNNTGTVPKASDPVCQEKLNTKREHKRSVFMKHKLTQYSTSDYSSPLPLDVEVLETNANSFISGLFEVESKPTDKLYLDKGCMTDTAEEKIAQSEGLDILVSFFPDLSKNCLEDVLEKCGNDISWAMNILIDGGYQLSKKSELKKFNILNEESSEEDSQTESSPNFSEYNFSSQDNDNDKNKSTLGNRIEVDKNDTNNSTSSEHNKEINLKQSASTKEKLEIPTKQNAFSDNHITSNTSDLSLSPVCDELKPQYLTLEINNAFASSLINIYGPVGSSKFSNASECSRKVVLPLELCHDIYKCWSETLDGKYIDESPLFDSFHEDEKLAHTLQHEESEKNTVMENSDPFKKDPPEFFKELVDIEMALELSKTSISSGKGDTLSQMVTLPTLPEEDKSTLGNSLNEDVKLAHTLQHEECKKTVMEDSDIFEKDPPAFFKELVDIEMALELSKSSISNDADDTMSQMLTLQKLQEEFSHVDPSEVENQYLSQSCDYKNTKSLLTYIYGLSKQSTVPSPSKVKEIVDAEAEQDIQVHSPQVYRDEAQVHYMERKKAMSKAQESSRRGLHAAASYYSQVGNFHHQKFKESNARASQKILEAVNTSKGPNTLDLHMLHIPEALRQTQRFLSERKRYMTSRKIKNHQVEIITGKGNHSSGGEARLKPAIELFLTNENYSFEKHAGLFKVNLVLEYDNVS